MRKDSRRDRWSKPKLREECASKFQRLRRLQEADSNGICTCVTCGVRGHFNEMEGGHYFTRKKNSTLLDPMNVHPQCNNCNRWNDGQKGPYLAYLVKRYGQDQVDYLTRKGNETKQFRREELVDLYEKICDELTIAEKRFK